MLGNFVTVDGVSSRTLGLFCKQLPMWPVAVESKNAISVGGRAENIYQSAGNYNDIQIEIGAVLVGFDMDPVNRYFRKGKKIVLSNQPDRYGVIRQLVAVDQSRVGNGALELKITLKCAPFKYRLANTPVDYAYSANPTYFKTVGNIFSEPLIVAEGCSSGFTMTLNGATITTTGLTGDVYFDVSKRVVYTEDQYGVKTVVQGSTSGNIWDLLLVPSDVQYNQLTFSNATSVEITPNERWL